MELELEYENMSAVPEAYRDLYQEKDGRAVLAGVKGMKTQADVDAVRNALSKERNEHKATRDKLKGWDGLDKDEVLGKLDLLKGIEDKIGGDLSKLDESDLVKGKISQATGPLTREIENLKKARGEIETENTQLKQNIRNRDIRDIVKEAAVKAKVHGTAILDIETAAASMMDFDDSGKLLTKDGLNGVTAGLGADEWLGEMQKLRPHWWPESVGGGAGGGGRFLDVGKNPFSRAHWNMTEQGKIVREKGMEFAGRLAAAAGTTVGGQIPAEKR